MCLELLKTSLTNWEYLGVSTLKTGEIVYGAKQENIAYRFFHLLLPPLGGAELNRFLEFAPAMKGTQYFDCLQGFNGAMLYKDRMFFYGVHPEYGSEAATLFPPWDIISSNIEDTMIRDRYVGVVIGGAESERRNKLFLESSQGTFLVVDKDSEELLREFPTLNELVASEIQRLDEEQSR